MAEVRFTRVAKRYGAVSVIPELDLTVPSGSFTVLVGPSGCGKSTLLRMVAGLEEVSAGTIHIDGQDVTHADPAHRGIAMVFQSYALYPHMSVADNIGFGLRLSGMPKAEVARQVKDAADILQLGHLLDRKPPALSGGQRQRVAIGRAIVRKPKVFLFDEPLSNLDAALRAQMRIELAELHARLGATMIYVTHDQVEAMTMADKIVVLSGGHIEQAGPPMQLYRAPQTEFVAGFIGSPKMNFITGAQAAQLGAQTVGIRPEHLVPGEHGPLRGRVRHVEHLGGETLIPADIDGIGPMTARVNGECDIAHAAPIAFGYDSGALHRFTGGNRIADPV